MIAVTHAGRFRWSVKSLLFLFDKIAVTDIDSALSTIINPQDDANDWLVREFDWLREQGLVIAAEMPDDLKPTGLPITDATISTLRSFLVGRLRSIRKGQTDDVDDIPDYGSGTIPASCMSKRLKALESRLSASYMRERLDLETTPLLETAEDMGGGILRRKTDITHIVLTRMPMPDESTPWEAVVEYRADPDTHHKLLALRNWMADIARTDYTKPEIEDKLAWALREYERHLELHKLKYCTGVFETLIVGAAEVLENLAKFKWGKLAKSLFTIRHRKYALLEQELKLPGAEVAYVSKTRAHFSAVSEQN